MKPKDLQSGTRYCALLEAMSGFMTRIFLKRPELPCGLSTLIIFEGVEPDKGKDRQRPRSTLSSSNIFATSELAGVLT